MCLCVLCVLCFGVGMAMILYFSMGFLACAPCPVGMFVNAIAYGTHARRDVRTDTYNTIHNMDAGRRQREFRASCDRVQRSMKTCGGCVVWRATNLCDRV